MGRIVFEPTGHQSVKAQFTCANGFPCSLKLPSGPSALLADGDTAELMVSYKRAALTKEQAGYIGAALLRFANDIDQEAPNG